MKEIIEQLVEKASTDRKLLSGLKCAAVDAKLYELAAKLRDIEIQKWPKAHADSPEMQEAKQFDVAMRMAGINAELPVVWKLLQVFRAFEKMKGDTDTATMAKIEADAFEIFGE